jgi:hypothetical protein
MNLATRARIFFVVLLAVSLVGLKLTTPAEPAVVPRDVSPRAAS